jgi:opacity protein-like surface antigen
MLKKILFTSVAMIVTSHVAMAAPAPYIGAGLGITANTSNNSDSKFSSYRGMPFNIFAGYGGIVNQNLYLAGELNGTLLTGELSNGGSNSLKTSYGYSASIIPGIMLSDHTMAYARAGVVRSRFPNSHTMSTGGQAGLGLQTTLTQNIDLRGEYDLTAYRSINHHNMSTAPRSDGFNLGLVYKFD